MASGRTAWIDAAGGISGDMLLGACLDAGVPLEVIDHAISLLGLRDAVTVSAEEVRRGGFRATRAIVTIQESDGPHRTLDSITSRVRSAGLPAVVTDQAVAVFDRLAAAESRAHGITVDEVHFHEVGALDSIVDVVGAVASLHALGVTHLHCGTISLGGGTVSTAHGRLTVPGPAVLELLSASEAMSSGGPVEIELATPTGVAIATTLAERFGSMPPMTVTRVGVGAGTADPTGHANLCRLVVGEPTKTLDHPTVMTMIETNVDDLDPRLWPGVLRALMAAGAADAWLTPILMKKGRPAHTLHVLAEPSLVPVVEGLVFEHTSSIGLRTYDVDRAVLDRDTTTVHVDGQPIRVKRARRHHRVVNAEPEFDDVEAAALHLGLAAREVLGRAHALIRSLPPPIGDQTGHDGEGEDGHDDQH